MSKYDKLAIKCFGKPYAKLNQDEQIEIIDLFNERNE
jgi:hypothetical protein